MMLTDGYSDSEVIVLKVWSNILISKDYIDTNNGVLRILCPLEKEVDVYVFYPFQFSLTC